MSSDISGSRRKRSRMIVKKGEKSDIDKEKKEEDFCTENNNKRWSIGDSELVDMGVNALPNSGEVNLSEDAVKEVNSESPSKSVCNGCIENSNKSLNNEFAIRMKRPENRKNHQGSDAFAKLSDEVVLMIMQYLPRRSLYQCAQVCQRWRWVSYDESLWHRIDCSSRTLHTDSIYYILLRNPRVLRMSQTVIQSPLLKEFASNADDIVVKLEYLDLSMAVVESEDLALLLSKCKELRKLSLEHCITDEKVCKSVSGNRNLVTLNLSQCYELDEKGLTYIFENCKKLEDLNIQWTRLSPVAVELVCSSVNAGIKCLNMAGCGRNITDEPVQILLNRCQALTELDLSDCILLSETTVDNLLNYAPNLWSLSLNRCYRISIALPRLVKKPSLKFLNVFGLLQERQLHLLELAAFGGAKLNRSKFSTVARPTVGIRRTSIWNLRVRDF